MQHSIAKLFATGGSQAVRLPAEFRFDGTAEVYIRRDDATGDVILSRRPPADWRTFMEMREREGMVRSDALPAREQGEEQRDPFEGWKE
ncbi:MULTISPECIES: antitoxin [unclassified Variovorax]|uniref:antitoxin n=1 Tax=Variovorax atrisoli TaxID=3394203 RepID=UPI000F7F5FC0|nr:AbrB/MazE/SpoVT family DNA-binding domain-containing protein [Variovorax sp. 369]RTD86553.1 AbrB/MazE/SpoVT family DNA-binding domain-containing protein [Variovorax sp. 369]